MRIPRKMLVNSGQAQVFHVVSRVVDRRKIFGEKEKEVFLKIIRQMESFSGLEVLAYCLMGNHFHLIIYIPPRPVSISKDELWKRMKFIYSSQKLRELKGEVEDMKKNGLDSLEQEFYERVSKRMYDLSNYVREIKLRFSKWYNRENERKGTLWEERFKSLLIERNENALMKVGAYIELNPVRAGLVDQPHEYRWCSYTEAIAGGTRAQTGISKLVGGMEYNLSWKKALNHYRAYFMKRGSIEKRDKAGISQEAVQEALENEGALEIAEELRVKVRYFSDGVVLGSKRFIEDTLESKQGLMGKIRKKVGFKVSTKEEKERLYSYRKVK